MSMVKYEATGDWNSLWWMLGAIVNMLNGEFHISEGFFARFLDKKKISSYLGPVVYCLIKIF